MESELVLLDLSVSPFAVRVRIALAEKQVEYESREEDLSNKSDLLLKMNPVHQQIPVLIHDGKPICESLNIVQYIDEVWNHKSPLLPSHPHRRAHARFWADYIDKKIYPIGSRFWTSSKDEVKEGAKKELMECFKVLEEELGDKAYYGGDVFGFVDLALIPFYSFFYAFEMLGNINMQVEFPKLVEWAKRCMQKKSVSDSVCDHHMVYQAILQIQNKLRVREHNIPYKTAISVLCNNFIIE